MTRAGEGKTFRIASLHKYVKLWQSYKVVADRGRERVISVRQPGGIIKFGVISERAKGAMKREFSGAAERTIAHVLSRARSRRLV